MDYFKNEALISYHVLPKQTEIKEQSGKLSDIMINRLPMYHLVDIKQIKN